MPRDLESEKATLEEMAPLTKEMAKESDDSTPSTLFTHEVDDRDKLMKDMDEFDLRSELHPYVKTLTVSDVDSCVALENSAFPPNQRCSREKLYYRLTKCGELGLGVFTSSRPESLNAKLETLDWAFPADSSVPERKAILLAYVVATKTTNKTVQEEDMAVPSNWQNEPYAEPHLGHKEEGRTIAIHSLAVLPAYRGIGLGKMLLQAYIQRMQHSGIADRLALLTYDSLVPFYKSLGFECKGKSSFKYGGEEWNDMVLELPEPTKPQYRRRFWNNGRKATSAST